MRQLQLIRLYFYVCKVYEKRLKFCTQRFSNNQREPQFTDCELLTTWIFGIGYEKCRTDKQVYEHIANYWIEWFPDLPSYQAYNRRLNDVCSLYPVLVEELVRLQTALLSHAPQACFVVSDSMPVITCSAKRKAKVARHLCDKGYNATKSMYYYGVKLHALSWYEKGSLPIVGQLLMGAASEHDLEAQRYDLEQLKEQVVFVDKAFKDRDLEKLYEDNGGALMVPMKYHRGHDQQHRQRHKAADELMGRCFSTIRQPIESFFAWINERTGVQLASKVRSFKGLLKHVFGRIAAAFAVMAIEVDLI